MGPYILDMLVPVIFPYHEGTNVRNRCAAKVQTLAGETDVFVLLTPRCLLLVKLPILMVLKCGFTCMFDCKTGKTPNFDGYLMVNFPSNWPKTASTAPAAASAGAERVALPEPGFGTAPPRAERHPSCPAQPDGRRGGPLSILKLRPLLVSCL